MNLTTCFLLLTAVAGADDSLVIPNASVQLIRQVNVPATEQGLLVEMKVREGDHVDPKNPIARIDTDLLKSDLREAEVELEIAQEKSRNNIDSRFAKKSLEVAQSELRLSQDANRRVRGSISQTELDRLRLVVDRASLSIEQAARDEKIASLTSELKLAAVKAAQTRIKRRTISCPIVGRVAEILKQQGEWVNPGDTIARVVQLDRLRVEINLDGELFGADLEGRPVELSVRLPNSEEPVVFPGKVTYVSSEIQPVTNEVRVWAEVENPDLRLRPGDHGVLTILPSAPAAEKNSAATGEAEDKKAPQASEQK